MSIVTLFEEDLGRHPTLGPQGSYFRIEEAHNVLGCRFFAQFRPIEAFGFQVHNLMQDRPNIFAPLEPTTRLRLFGFLLLFVRTTGRF